MFNPTTPLIPSYLPSVLSGAGYFQFAANTGYRNVNETGNREEKSRFQHFPSRYVSPRTYIKSFLFFICALPEDRTYFSAVAGSCVGGFWFWVRLYDSMPRLRPSYSKFEATFWYQ